MSTEHPAPTSPPASPGGGEGWSRAVRDAAREAVENEMYAAATEGLLPAHVSRVALGQRLADAAFRSAPCPPAPPPPGGDGAREARERLTEFVACAGTATGWHDMALAGSAAYDGATDARPFLADLRALLSEGGEGRG